MAVASTRTRTAVRTAAEMRRRLSLGLPLLLSLLTRLTADETPPLSIVPDSPRPNRRYWRWEEFPAAALSEGCQPVERWKQVVKDEEARRVAEAAAELARLELEAAAAQCEASVERLLASSDKCENDGIISKAEVSCAGSTQGATDESDASWNCGAGLQRAVEASSSIDFFSMDPRADAVCLVPEAQPGLDAEPVEPLTCTQLVPATEVNGLWECTELCVFRQCGYTCEYNEYTEEMKCAWDLQPCAAAQQCSSADLTGEEEHSRNSCEAVPQGKGTACAYTSKSAAASHLICVVLFLGFVVLMLSSMVPLVSKPWWPPFQERGASVLLLNAVSSIVYAWATLVTDHHAPSWLLGGQTNARLWIGWLRLGFGFALWQSTVAVRLHAMGQLYLHDAEPLFWVVKLSQYLVPWIVLCFITTSTDDPKVTLSAGVILLSFFSFFHCMYLAAPLLKLTKTLPEVKPTAVSITASLLNLCWIYIGIDQESDDGCSEVVPLPCAPSDAHATGSARRFLGTVSTIAILAGHWIVVVGPLLLEYARGDPKFLEQFEAPPSKRAPDYAGPLEPEVPADFEDEADRLARRLRERGPDPEEERGAEGDGTPNKKTGFGASFSNILAGATTKAGGQRRFRKKQGDDSDGAVALSQLEGGAPRKASPNERIVVRGGEKLGV